ncbi:MAG: hypothetical protein KAS32_11835 [Candidatus Peribacteraceae bacterium]|nr:hypothetical protein [Candidatus Peribacteraceae bacterium]
MASEKNSKIDEFDEKMRKFMFPDRTDQISKEELDAKLKAVAIKKDDLILPKKLNRTDDEIMDDWKEAGLID